MIQWRIQDCCEGDAAGVWPPFFSEGMTPTFLQQIVSAHRRSQDFQRVGAPRGGSRISGWGTMEGPKPPNEARSAGVPRSVGSGEGRMPPKNV